MLMDKIKERIRKKLKAHLELSYRINSKPISKESMKKKTFIEIIKLLKEIDDRRDFMQTEIGMDVNAYEDKFFQVIEGLFKIAFNEKQLELVRAYLYDLSPDAQWDGKLTLKIGKKESTVDFKTPEQVWEVIKEI